MMKASFDSETYKINEIHKINKLDFCFRLQSTQNITYDVITSNHLFNVSNKSIINTLLLFSAKRCFVVVDNKVNKLYGESIKNYFSYNKIDVIYYVVYINETKKSLESAMNIISEMNRVKLLRRSEPMIVIGGGVLMDVSGLAANLYRRGLPYIKIPTTLVGMIDAGIAVKTGANFNNDKNRVGSYYSPKFVFLDMQFLNTLDQRNISNGMAEIIKIALIKDKSLFLLLEKYCVDIYNRGFKYDISHIEIIKRAVHGMLEELACNLWEENLERIVDYGHTFSPSIEMHAVDNMLHGEAVAIDMAFSLLLAEQRNYISLDDRNRAFNLMRSLALPLSHPICTAEFLYNSLVSTSIHRDNLQRVPLTMGIGNAIFINDITFHELDEVVNKMHIIAGS